MEQHFFCIKTKSKSSKDALRQNLCGNIKEKKIKKKTSWGRNCIWSEGLKFNSSAGLHCKLRLQFGLKLKPQFI